LKGKAAHATAAAAAAAASSVETMMNPVIGTQKAGSGSYRLGYFQLNKPRPMI
jgi:hypothetical protein